MSEIRSRFIEGLCRTAYFSRSHQPYRAVAQIAVLQKHEYRQKERERDRHERRHRRPRIFENLRYRQVGVLRDLDLDGLAFGLRISHLLLDVADRGGGLLPYTGAAQ